MVKTHNLLAFVGFKQSGKSTAASHLESKYGFVRHNFKDALISELKENFPDLLNEMRKTYEWEWSEDELFVVKPPLMRALMQNYGTEVRRKGDTNYWVGEWWKNFPVNQLVVTDDVRFLNEAGAITGAQGKIIRIIRTDITTGGSHSSETEQLQIQADYTIEVGAGEQDKLCAELDRIVGI